MEIAEVSTSNVSLQSSPKVRYIEHIDGLRALAVIVVFTFHLNVPYVTGGFVGVDIFFVISGFLITRLIVQEIEGTGTFSFRNFYFRRAKRIFPALIVTLLISSLVAGLLFAWEDFRRFGKILAASALSVSNIFFWRESGYFDRSSVVKPLLHTWSLGVEEQFYFFWPLFVFGVFYFLPRKLLPIFLGIMFVISLGLNFCFQNIRPDPHYYLAPFRVFEFCIGAGMVDVLKAWKMPKRMINELLCLLGLGLILYSLFMFDRNTIFPSYRALVPCCGAAFIIYAGHAPWSGFIFCNRISRRIGIVSYSIYLLHWPVIVLYSYFKAAEANAMERCVIFLFVLISAHLMYAYVEQPFRNHKSDKRLFYGCCYGLVLLGIVLLGASIYANNGWTWRLSNHTQHVLKLMEKHKEAQRPEYPWGGKLPEWIGWTCKLGEESPDIVLLGDSFSRVLQYGLREAVGKPRNLSIFYIRTQCLPLPDSYSKAQVPKTICRDSLERAIDLVLEKEDSVFVLSVSWYFRILQRRRLSTGKSLAVEQPRTYAGFANVTDDLTKLRERLGARRFVLVGSPPMQLDEQADTVETEMQRTCLFRPYLGRLICVQHEGVSIKARPNRWNLQINKMLMVFASEHANTFFANLYESLCADKYCPFFSGEGVPYFRDQFHVSTTGSFKVVAEHKNLFFNAIWPQNFTTYFSKKSFKTFYKGFRGQVAVSKF